MKALIEYTQTRYPRVTLSMGESGQKISDKIKSDGKKFDTLYRGVPSSRDFLESLSEGDSVRVNHKLGFVSTSKDESVARRFASDDDAEIRVIFEIHNAHGLDVSELSKWDEQEVLLEKKATFEVKEIKRTKGATYYKIIVE